MTRVLVTGSAGFVGGHLMERLAADGTPALGLDRVEAPSDVDFLHVDLLDSLESDTLATALRGVTHVVHLAAEAYVPDSVPDPLRYVDNNVVATARFVEALRRSPSIERFVQVSSCEVYGTTLEPVDETAPTDPASPYAASKLAQEAYVQTARHCYGLPVTTVRLFNNYGPRQQDNRLIPSIRRSAASGDPFTMTDGGRQTRDWVDVRDACDALVRLLTASDVVGEVFNVCAEAEFSVSEIVSMSHDFLSAPPPVIEAPGICGALTRSTGWGKKLRTSTGWSPDGALPTFLRSEMAEVAPVRDMAGLAGGS